MLSVEAAGVVAFPVATSARSRRPIERRILIKRQLCTRKETPMKRNIYSISLALSVLLVLGLVAYNTAASKFSDWAAPVNLGPVVNSPFNDFAPAFSKNGLSLYFSSDRPGSLGI